MCSTAIFLLLKCNNEKRPLKQNQFDPNCGIDNALEGRLELCCYGEMVLAFVRYYALRSLQFLYTHLQSLEYEHVCGPTCSYGVHLFFYSANSETINHFFAVKKQLEIGASVPTVFSVAIHFLRSLLVAKRRQRARFRMISFNIT